MTKPALLLSLGLCLAGLPAGAQEVTSVARHAPANSYFAVASSEVAQTCQAFQQTRLGETLCGPAFRPLVDELRRRELAGPLYLRPAFGFDWSDLEQLHTGGGVFIFPVGDAKLGAAWIFSGSGGFSEGPLAAALGYFERQGFARSAARHSAAREVTVLRPRNKRQDDSPRVLFVAQEYYGIANSLEAAAVVLSGKPERSLANEAAWQQSSEAGAAAGPRPGDATVMIRPLPLWELMRRDRDSKKPAEPKPAAAQKNDKQTKQRDGLASARQLGLGGVTAISGRVSFAAQSEHDWQIDAVLAVPHPLEKALRLLKLRAGPPPEWPAWIAANITSASFWRWDFPVAMKGFGNLFDEANEPGPDGVGLFEDMLDGLRDDPEGVQVDLRREVFEHLGPEMLSITDRYGPRTQEMPEGDRALYWTRVRDEAQVLDALKRFYRGDERVRHARAGNYDVWTVPEGSSLFVEGESDSVVSVRALALGEGQMLFSTDPDLLQSALGASPGGAPFKDHPVWSRLWKSMDATGGSSNALWAMSRLDLVLEPSYARATSDKRDDEESLASGLWRVLLFGTADKDVDVPYAAAPPYDRVRSALSPAGTLMSVTPAGFSITTSALRIDTSR